MQQLTTFMIASFRSISIQFSTQHTGHLTFLKSPPFRRVKARQDIPKRVRVFELKGILAARATVREEAGPQRKSGRRRDWPSSKDVRACHQHRSLLILCGCVTEYHLHENHHHCLKKLLPQHRNPFPRNAVAGESLYLLLRFSCFR